MSVSRKTIVSELQVEIIQFVELIRTHQELIQTVLIGAENFFGDETKDFHVALRNNIRKLIEQLRTANNYLPQYQTFLRNLEPTPEYKKTTADTIKSDVAHVEPLRAVPPSDQFKQLKVLLNDLVRFNQYLEINLPKNNNEAKQDKKTKKCHKQRPHKHLGNNSCLPLKNRMVLRRSNSCLKRTKNLNIFSQEQLLR